MTDKMFDNLLNLSNGGEIIEYIEELEKENNELSNEVDYYKHEYFAECDSREELEVRLKELVDKSVPKKPIEKHYEDEGEPEYIKVCCPAGCKVQVGSYYNYCPECGQAIDWEGRNK